MVGFSFTLKPEAFAILAYVQEVRFSGGAKKYSPYVYPPIFRGGQVSPGVSWGWQVYPGVWQVYPGVSFFSNEQKKVRCIF